MSTTTITSLGHGVRQQLWDDIVADGTYALPFKQQIDSADCKAAADRARYQLKSIEAHERELWDALANVQDL